MGATLNELQLMAASAAASGGQAPLGYQQLATLSSVIGLTPPAGATIAVLNPETKAVRWRDDGTNPSASVGMVIAAGGTYVYAGKLSTLKFIEAEASAKLNVSYY